MTKEKAIQVLANFYATTKNPKANHFCEAVYIAIQALRNEPKRGHWLNCGWSIRCSECGYDMPFSTRNYCPNCGADMRGEKDG